MTKKRSFIFPILMVLYALLALIGIAYGMGVLEDFLTCYEQSRTHIPIDRYMAQLTPEHICDTAVDLIAQVDPKIQTEEEARQVILSALEGGFSYAKHYKECTDTKQVYVLKAQDRVIGRFQIEPTQPLDYQLTAWTVTAEAFDLSFLLSDTVSTTVHNGCTVYVNGKPLGASAVTASGMIFSELAEFYQDLPLPQKVSYAAGPCLGPITMEIRDPNGNPIPLDTDPVSLLDNCTQEQKDALTSAAESFVTDYVRFVSKAGGNSERNYHRLVAHILPDSPLKDRMYEAIQGLNWISDRGTKMQSITINRLHAMEDGRYLCDVTYHVTTKDSTGMVEANASLKIIFLQTEDGLKVETMRSY